MIAHQDYELAEQFMNSDMSFCLNEDGSMKDGKTVGKHLFQMEGIFLDYFFKRLDIYNACQMPTFIKYYRGVDLEKYKDRIRLITDEYPYQNERGEFI